jgi:hypothetical protein
MGQRPQQAIIGDEVDPVNRWAVGKQPLLKHRQPLKRTQGWLG